MNTGCKVRWAGMVTTSLSQSYQLLECRATEPRENKIVAKGETEWENRKQALEMIFYLNSFTYHEHVRYCSRKSFYWVFFQFDNMWDIKW